MNWARVAFFVFYAAAVCAAAYFLQSPYLALWGLLGFFAVVVLWGALRHSSGFAMLVSTPRDTIIGNVNKTAEQLYSAMTNVEVRQGHLVHTVLRDNLKMLFETYNSRETPVYPTSWNYPAYLVTMPRYVFDPVGREVGDVIVELCKVEQTWDEAGNNRIETTLFFPICRLSSVEVHFKEIHRYYDGIKCGYTGKRVVVLSIDYVPTIRPYRAEYSYKDFNRLIRVVLATDILSSAEMEEAVQTFEKARRTDEPFYHALWRSVKNDKDRKAEAEARPRHQRALVTNWFEPHDKGGGHLRDGYLYFGDRHLENGEPYWVPIKKLTHFLVSGMSGSGKSYFLHQVLEGVAYNQAYFDDVYLIDLKGGVELWRYNGTADGLFHVIYKYDEVAEMVEGLNALMDERLDSMRERGLRDWDGRKVMVVIDEYAELSFEVPEDKEAKARKAKMLAGMARLSAKARAAGIILWAQLQKGTTDVMDSGFRNNLQSEVMFCQKTKLQAATVFGAVDSLSVDPTRLQAGEFVMLDATSRDLVYLKARMMRGL